MSTLRGSNSIPTIRLPDYPKRNTIVPSLPSSVYLQSAPSLIAPSKNFSVFYPSVRGLSHWVDPFYAIYLTFSKDYHISIHLLCVHYQQLLTKRNLLWWTTILPQWSATLLITSTRCQTVFYCDASGLKGIGGWWGHQAFSTRLPRQHRTKKIDWKEAYAILFAFAKWGEIWERQSVLIMSNNAVVLNTINTRTVHGQAIDPLQLLFFTTALYNIEISSNWLFS